MTGAGNQAGAENREQRYQLMKVALGEAEADLAIVNGATVNVYTGEVLEGASVLIKGDKIAYVGKNGGKSIGSLTRVIDAGGKTLIPGLIDGHAHMDSMYSISELSRYAVAGGTTTIITEASNIAAVRAYEGISALIRSGKKQPMKVFVTVPPMVTLSPVTEEHAITVNELRKLLRRKGVIGLGEPYWGGVVGGNQRVLDLIAETIRMGRKVEGHSAGASSNKLQAYISSGVSSCHEPITAEEVMERLRLGLFIFIREGEIRRDLEAIAKIRDENIDFTGLALSTDGIGPWELIDDGYMDFVVQKAINLGFNPVLAVQMASIHPARHFGLDHLIGGIAPGKYADIVIVPDLRTIRVECVISNGQVAFQNGRPVVWPKRYKYPSSVRNSIRLAQNFTTDDLAIPVESSRSQVKIRLIDQVTNLVTREGFADMPVSDGQLKPNASQDILKVAAIERSYRTGKSFVGFIRGMGLKHGAIGTSYVWDCGDIIVVGADETDMAQVINRIKGLNGGIVVCAGSRILAEIALPVAGTISTEPMETVAARLHEIQRAATDLGCNSPDIRTTLAVLSTPAIPFLRICEHGLFNLRQNQFVDLIVE
jgi:adenine deaminase